MSYGQIARVHFFLSDEGVRLQIDDFSRQNGKLQPGNGGSEARPFGGTSTKAGIHLEETNYTRTSDIADYVFDTFVQRTVCAA